MAPMKTFIFQALVGLVILQSVPAFMVSFGSSRLGCTSSLDRTVRSCFSKQQQQQQHQQSWLQMSSESTEEEMNALDKALVAWGVKSPPGEPDVDLKDKIKSAGLAGALAYGGTELAFWVISVPLAVVGYHQTTGEWLDLTTLEGKEELFGLTAGFLTFARLVVPLRIALALALTPAMDKYVVKGFLKRDEGEAVAVSEDGGSVGAAEVDDARPVKTMPPPTETIGDGLTERIREAEVRERGRRLRERLFGS